MSNFKETSWLPENISAKMHVAEVNVKLLDDSLACLGKSFPFFWITIILAQPSLGLLCTMTKMMR